MNQTMFDVPDPLVVHVLLLTHEFYDTICLLLILSILTVTAHVFHVVPKTQMIPPL